MKKVNERIKERRIILGLTLAEIADKLGVKEATVQRYESGEIKNMKHETIVELADILHCSPQYLMGWSDNIIEPKQENLQLVEKSKNKNVMAKNIKYYMSLHNETRKYLSKLMNVPYTTFCDWVNARTYPRIDKIEALANHWKIQKADLVEPPIEKKNKFKIPVLGIVRAGYPIEAEENILDYEEISENMSRQGDFFALKVKGDSMEPKFSEGNIVIVRKQSDVDNGDIAIMLINGNDATIKKIQKSPNGISLIPLNTTSYDVMFYTNQEIEELPVTCLGKVVELRAKF